MVKMSFPAFGILKGKNEGNWSLLTRKCQLLQLTNIINVNFDLTVIKIVVCLLCSLTLIKTQTHSGSWSTVKTTTSNYIRQAIWTCSVLLFLLFAVLLFTYPRLLFTCLGWWVLVKKQGRWLDSLQKIWRVSEVSLLPHRKNVWLGFKELKMFSFQNISCIPPLSVHSKMCFWGGSKITENLTSFREGLNKK